MASATAQCVVCCHESSTWSIGVCDHPICLTCSARLRVLCEQTTCPVCRVDLKQVVVTQEVKPFALLYQGAQCLTDRKYGLTFQTSELRDQYISVRSHRCTKCPNDSGTFGNFDELGDHARKVHGLYYCDICIDNLKLFPREHKAYTRQDLATHRRDGDPKDSSHKGHPLCQFCDDRFLDNDALLHHLRSVHQWCHVCEGLGKGQDYYADYHSLRQHFRREHFLCEEGPCRHVKVTSVFATKIDLQAHRAAEHSSGLSKAEVKQLRQIEVGFTYNRRAAAEEVCGHRGPPRSRAEEREREDADVSAAIHASRHAAGEQSTTSSRRLSPTLGQASRRLSPTLGQASRRLSPTLGQANDSAVLVKGTAQSTTLKGGSNKKHPSAGNERKRKDRLNVSADKKTSGLSVGRTEEDSRPQVCAFEVAPSSVVVAAGDVLDNEGIKTASNTTKARKPPGFEHLLPAEEVMPSVEETTTHAVTLVDPPVLAVAPAVQDNWPSMTKLHSKATHPMREDWPSLKVSEPSTQAKSRNTSAPPGYHQPTAKATLMSVISRVKASVESRDAFEEFRTLSGQYSSGLIAADQYHSKCLGLFGEHTWSSLGPELATTLPDEAKQKELLAMFQKADRGVNHRSKPRAPPGMSRVQKSGVWTSRMDRNLCDEQEFPSLRDAVDLPDYPQPTPGWNSRVLGTAT